MKELYQKEHIVQTEYNTYELCYGIHQIREEDMDLYGISISQYESTNQRKKLFDEAMIKAFSDNLQDTRAFFDLLVNETVFPVHLLSVADDWHGQIEY
ncbi:MAG: DUF6514 family protein [Eubacteriales bacterium]|nr:DUF6514 family protein [Eubacteriales bacterium]